MKINDALNNNIGCHKLHIMGKIPWEIINKFLHLTTVHAFRLLLLQVVNLQYNFLLIFYER